MPPATLRAYKDHGHPEDRLGQAVDRARGVLAQLAQFGLDIDAVTTRLETEGVAAFARSWQSLLDTVARRRDALRLATRTKARWDRPSAPLPRARGAGERPGRRAPVGRGPHAVEAPAGHPRDREQRLAGGADAESRGRRGDRRPGGGRARRRHHAGIRLRRRRRRVAAPPLLRRALGVGRGGLDVHVLDAADPAAVLAAAERGDPARTLHVLCATGPSGSVRGRVRACCGRVRARPSATRRERTSSRSARRAAPRIAGGEHGFRRMFRTPADVSGRWAALSALGLVPAALLGADLGKLLERARRMATACDAVVPPPHDPGLWLGAALGRWRAAGATSSRSSSPTASSPSAHGSSSSSPGRPARTAAGWSPSSARRSDRRGCTARIGCSCTCDSEPDRIAWRRRSPPEAHPVLTIGLTDGYDLGGRGRGAGRWRWRRPSHLLDVPPLRRAGHAGARGRRAPGARRRIAASGRAAPAGGCRLRRPPRDAAGRGPGPALDRDRGLVCAHAGPRARPERDPGGDPQALRRRHHPRVRRRGPPCDRTAARRRRHRPRSCSI